MKAVFLLDDKNYRRIYSNETIEKIESKVENLGRYDIDQLEDIDLSTVDFIFSGWKGAKIDRYLLEKMPNLKVVFYGAGSIKKIQTQEMWNRKIRITSASAINAIPVAQYTFSIIQLACKDFFRLTREIEKVRK
ncbi:MAG: hypothetical protein Q4B23_05285, partial [Helcococcus sp.]|nr:hypothetical protein [Helcococcus sp.]